MVLQKDGAPIVVAGYLAEIDVVTVNVATTQEKQNTPIVPSMDGFALSLMRALVLIAENKETRES